MFSLSSSVLLADFVKFVGFRLGFKLSEMAAKRLYSYIKGIPETGKEIFSYDRKIRYEALSEIVKCRKNVLLGINSIEILSDEELLKDLRFLKSNIEEIRNLIESSQNISNPSAKGPIYLDLILLSGCFALNEQTRSLLDKIRFSKVDEAQSTLKETNENIRKISSILHIRSIALNIPDKHFLNFLEAEYNSVYESLRNLAILAYSSSEEKKGFFKREKNHKLLAGRVLYAIKTLEARMGPEIDLNTFYVEFRKLNPDIEVSPEDINKALSILMEDGWLRYSIDAPRRIWTKMDQDRILELAKDKHIQEGGLTVGELMRRTKWSADYALYVLNNLEERGIARISKDSDGTIRWFFPGLQSENENA